MDHATNLRQCGRVVSALDSQCSSHRLVRRLAGFVLCHPEFRSFATLVNSQLVASCYVVFKLFVSKYLSGVSVN